MRNLCLTMMAAIALGWPATELYAQDRGLGTACHWRLGAPIPMQSADGRQVYVENAAVFELGRGLAVLGFPAVIHPPEGEKAKPLMGFLVRGGVAEPIAYPEVDHVVQSPRFFQERSGRIHALWGRSTEKPYGIIDEIWHAVLIDHDWKGVERLVDAKGTSLEWERSVLAPMATRQERLGLAVSANRSARDSGVLLMIYSRGKWTIREAGLETISSYAALAFGPDDLMVVAYAAPVPQTSTGGLRLQFGDSTSNRVFSRVSRDGGQSWSRPRRMSGQVDPGHYVGLLARAGEIALIWAEHAERDSLFHLRAATSRDGAEWALDSMPPATALIGGYSTAIRADGSLLMLGSRWDAGIVLKKEAGDWCLGELGFPALRIGPPRLSQIGRRTMVSWASPPIDQNHAPGTQIAELLPPR